MTDASERERDDPEYEYVAHRPDYFGETTFDTRHDAVGHAAILSRHLETDDDDDPNEFEVFARRTTREPMTNDALWRARITDKSGDEWEHVGWTLLYETRSFATEAAYRYMLMNHRDEVSVSSMPWYGEDYRQVGALEAGSDEQYPIYVGFDDDGKALEHDANQLQYADHVTRTALNRFERRGNEPDVDPDDCNPEDGLEVFETREIDVHHSELAGALEQFRDREIDGKIVGAQYPTEDGKHSHIQLTWATTTVEVSDAE